MMVDATATPFLTATEIDELCAPLTQRHAQMRHLCALLDVDSLPRRPDGLPLVGRKLIEERLNRTGTYKAPAGFNWSK
jgi:hypothetical protein